MTTLPVPNLDLPQGHSQTDRPKLYLLDYGAGNVRSLANSIHKLGYDFEWVKDASDLEKAEVSSLVDELECVAVVLIHYASFRNSCSPVLAHSVTP